MSMPILAIDSGNSFIKWGLYGNKQWIRKGKVHHLELSLLHEHFIELTIPSKIIVSHVGSAVTCNKISQSLQNLFPVESFWISSQKNGFGIINYYDVPSQLGSDRWAALIAAWDKSNHRSCLVVNVGTAMTIDALSERGEFLGGIIVPSSHLMLESLFSGTQLLNQKSGYYKDFPRNTSDAIQSGIIQSLIGAIKRMYELLSTYLDNSEIKCVISGGGAKILTPHISLPILEVDEIVLEGLAIIGANSDN